MNNSEFGFVKMGLWIKLLCAIVLCVILSSCASSGAYELGRSKDLAPATQFVVHPKFIPKSNVVMVGTNLVAVDTQRFSKALPRLQELAPGDVLHNYKMDLIIKWDAGGESAYEMDMPVGCVGSWGFEMGAFRVPREFLGLGNATLNVRARDTQLEEDVGG